MERDNSDAVMSAFDLGREGGTAESCMTCKKLLDAAHQIVEMSIQRARDRVIETKHEWNLEPPVANLGSLVDILRDPSCEDHKAFIRSALLLNPDDPLPRSGASEEGLTVEVRWSASKGRFVLCRCDGDGRYHADTILLADMSCDSGLSCIGRVRDGDFINIGLMKEWISTCEQLHTSTCCVPASASISLSWMIDTASRWLVPAWKGIRYVALSYVWGQTEMLKTTSETLSDLRQPGALDANTCLKMPPVIRHAIALLPRLGERYLWVDSLCITQDDTESLARHIRHMTPIYEAASFTIVAADGIDANHGIPGIKGVSTARSLPPSLSLTSRLRLRPRGSLDILDSPWGSRGWTLQEHAFSRKKLVFVHSSVQWICQERRCFEDICQESPSIRKKRIRDYDMEQELESVGELAVQYPMISQLESLVFQYTSRNLTHQYDILNAIDSVFTAHKGAFPHGFFWGLPVDYLDLALLWTGSRNHGLRRCEASPSPSQPRFPSWTWAGWIGTIAIGQWSAETYIKNADENTYLGAKKYQTMPICEWRQWNSPDSSEWCIQGQNSAHIYKQRFMGKKDGLPPGWKYERETFGPHHLDGDAYDRWKDDAFQGSKWTLFTPYYYSHEAAPGVKFWHPVPISLDPTSNTTAAPTDCGLLCARTRSGSLWAMGAKDHPAVRSDDSRFRGLQRADLYVDLFSGEVIVDTVLTNRNGDLVGYLDINDQSDRNMVEDYESHTDEAGYSCKLVAISKGNDFVHPMEPEKEEYTFYNVLWVKWEDGIAYRRGVGQVKRETWESMELEDIDLVLG